MLHLAEGVSQRLNLVRTKCAELEREHPELHLLAELEECLQYATGFGDARDESGSWLGRSHNHLATDCYHKPGTPLGPEHFSFILHCYREWEDGRFSKHWLTMGMIYHNGAGMNDGSFSVELVPRSTPGWSFHS